MKITFVQEELRRYWKNLYTCKKEIFITLTITSLNFCVKYLMTMLKKLMGPEIEPMTFKKPWFTLMAVLLIKVICLLQNDNKDHS